MYYSCCCFDSSFPFCGIPWYCSELVADIVGGIRFILSDYTGDWWIVASSFFFFFLLLFVDQTKNPCLLLLCLLSPVDFTPRWAFLNFKPIIDPKINYYIISLLDKMTAIFRFLSKHCASYIKLMYLKSEYSRSYHCK